MTIAVLVDEETCSAVVGISQRPVAIASSWTRRAFPSPNLEPAMCTSSPFISWIWIGYVVAVSTIAASCLGESVAIRFSNTSLLTLGNAHRAARFPVVLVQGEHGAPALPRRTISGEPVFVIAVRIHSSDSK